LLLTLSETYYKQNKIKEALESANKALNINSSHDKLVQLYSLLLFSDNYFYRSTTIKISGFG
ncbi:MAG: hypothetical protein JSV96_09235, partial [Candidatus Aminicenantes bacterium]